MKKIATILTLLCPLVSARRDLVEHDESKYEQATARGSTATCILHFGFDDESEITNGESFQSPDNDDLFLIQSGDGNLVVMKDDRILWESGVPGMTGSYLTEIIDDNGFIATYNDKDELLWTSASSDSRSSAMVEPYWVWKPDGIRTTKGKRPDPPVWTSGNAARGGSSSTQYFFGMDCDYRYVAVFEGTPNDPGDRIWMDRTLTEEPTTSPTTAPTTDPDAPFSFYVMGDGTTTCYTWYDPSLCLVLFISHSIFFDGCSSLLK